MEGMVEVGGSKRFVKYGSLDKGETIVDHAEYVRTYEGDYGLLHDFKENDEIVVLPSAGQLNWLVANHLKPNDVVSVVYEGKEKLDKGKMKGKEAHRFKVFKGKVKPLAQDNVGSIENHADLDALE